MGVCLIHRTSVPFKAWITVTATPSSTVTVSLDGTTVGTGTANASTGQIQFLVKKKGTYSVTSNASGTQTKTVSITTRKQQATTNIVGKFTLTLTNATINSLTAATVAVSRTSSPYAGAATGSVATNGAIYYGDVLTVTGTLSSTKVNNVAVYGSLGVKVNNTTFTNGGSHTVTGNTTALVTASVNSWTLTITNASVNGNSAATVAVSRTSSTYQGAGTGSIATNSTVYCGDVLTITVTNVNSTKFNAPTLKVNNAAFTSGSTHTVSAAVAAVATSSAKGYTLTLTAGTGSSLAVSRTSSPLGAGTGALSNGATVYYGDVITKTSGAASTGFGSYSIAQSGVTGTANAGPWTVTGTCSLKATATPTKYTLTSSGLNANNPVTITRTARSTAGTAAGVSTNVNLSNGAAIYYDDTLRFTNAPKTNYSGNYSFTGTNSNASNQTATLDRYVRGNVTVTSTASYVISTFYVNQQATSSFPKGNYTFSYPKAIISTFANIAGNSTYCKSAEVASSGGTKYYGKIEVSNNILYFCVYLSSSNEFKGRYRIYNSSNTLQSPSSTITAGHTYKNVTS